MEAFSSSVSVCCAPRAPLASSAFKIGADRMVVPESAATADRVSTIVACRWHQATQPSGQRTT
jgi:hypothetical protein